MQVIRVSLLLPTNNAMEDGMPGIKTQNRLELVQPAVELVSIEDRAKHAYISSGYKTFSEILPDWKIEVVAADTNGSSVIGPLEAFRLRCTTG